VEWASGEIKGLLGVFISETLEFSLLHRRTVSAQIKHWQQHPLGWGDDLYRLSFNRWKDGAQTLVAGEQIIEARL
jgi:hypothetical protein